MEVGWGVVVVVVVVVVMMVGGGLGMKVGGQKGDGKKRRGKYSNERCMNRGQSVKAPASMRP